MKRIVYRLELFELLGIAASSVAVIVFFRYGRALDQLMRVRGYHLHMLWVIVDIYSHFVPWALLVGTALFVLMAFWLRRQGKSQPLARYVFGIRVFFAYCLLLIVFRVVNFYVPVLHPGLRDDVIQWMDAHVLGTQMENILAPLATPWLTDLLTGAYVFWFWLLFLTIVVLVWKSKEALSEYLFASMLAFYIGYVCYVLVPVIGPGYTLHNAVVVGGLAPHFTTSRLTVARDCFPSLHTGLSVLMSIYVWRHHRRFIWFYGPVAALIIFATLYLRFHYFSDDVAGACLAVVVGYFAPVCHQAWLKLRSQGL